MSTKVISVRNVNDALSVGLEYLLKHGKEAPSRNGTVIVAPGPVVTEYEKPWERVLFSLVRRANPFFHLMESLWMLAGRNDIAFPSYFNKRFVSYSDDGRLQHGAYGHRWRNWFGFDQLDWIVRELREHPNSRRAVLTMWDGARDPQMVVENGVDVPCNTQAYFEIRDKKLNMTVCCRSNDMIWGGYGANAVHFSILQEYIATQVGVDIGVYRQISNNYHVYTDVYPRSSLEAMMDESCRVNYYSEQSPIPMKTFPLITQTHCSTWDAEVIDFVKNPYSDRFAIGDCDTFFTNVAVPMYYAWDERKKGLSDGMYQAGFITAPDWRLACCQWIQQTDAAKGVLDGTAT